MHAHDEQINILFTHQGTVVEFGVCRKVVKQGLCQKEWLESVLLSKA